MSTDPDAGKANSGRPEPAQPPDYNILREAARAGHVKVEITPKETPKERERRLDDESKDADLERWKERVHVIFTISLLAVVVVGCLIILAMPSRPETEKRWAMSALALIVGGAIGRTYGQSKGAD